MSETDSTNVSTQKRLTQGGSELTGANSLTTTIPDNFMLTNTLDTSSGGTGTVDSSVVTIVSNQRESPVCGNGISSLMDDDDDDKTAEACALFHVIDQSIYSAKYLGYTEHALECDCTEQFSTENGVNEACGSDSDCINRATKMECTRDCGCGVNCRNQRFQKKQYANVSVIRTGKKGYGLRANEALNAHDFIYEYVGEVINETSMRKRMLQYDEEGIRHFYFMSLNKGEFVDATRKGNLSRFCNHSCRPSCYVDKWVVGDKLRMGIFALRSVSAGEELTFNYNVDRYGAEPQPCYCGQDNCTGFIGGKTQTNGDVKLPLSVIGTLGVNSDDEIVGQRKRGVGKRRIARRKSYDDDDYETEYYEGESDLRIMNETDVKQVMSSLVQCKEKWIGIELLNRLQRSKDEKAMNLVAKLHGYEILKSALTLWGDDPNVVMQVLDILFRLPRITRNKIQESKIEEVVDSLRSRYMGQCVEARATELLQIWAKLEIGYRIPRVNKDGNGGRILCNGGRISPHVTIDAAEAAVYIDERRSNKYEPTTRSSSQSPQPPTGPRNPAGSRSHHTSNYQHGHGHQTGHRRWTTYGNKTSQSWFPRPKLTRRLMVKSGNGNGSGSGSGSGSGGTTNRKGMSDTEKLEAIIQGIVGNKSNKYSVTPGPSDGVHDNPWAALGEATSQMGLRTHQAAPSRRVSTPILHDDAQPPPSKGSRSEVSSSGKPKEVEMGEEWKKWNLDKQMRLYENTLHPVIKDVMNRFRGKLSRDELKKFGREIAKKLVASDYKNNRVNNPTIISDKQERQIRKFVHDYFEKAVAKKRALESSQSNT